MEATYPLCHKESWSSNTMKISVNCCHTQLPALDRTDLIRPGGDVELSCFIILTPFWAIYPCVYDREGRFETNDIVKVLRLVGNYYVLCSVYLYGWSVKAVFRLLNRLDNQLAWLLWQGRTILLFNYVAGWWVIGKPATTSTDRSLQLMLSRPCQLSVKGLTCGNL